MFYRCLSVSESPERLSCIRCSITESVSVGFQVYAAGRAVNVSVAATTWLNIKCQGVMIRMVSQ